MSGTLLPGRPLPGTNILERIFRMRPHRTPAGRVLLAAGALALVLATDFAHADGMGTDRHEIPTFVLDRTEIAARPNAAAIATPEVLR